MVGPSDGILYLSGRDDRGPVFRLMGVHGPIRIIADYPYQEVAVQVLGHVAGSCVISNARSVADLTRVPSPLSQQGQ